MFNTREDKGFVKGDRVKLHPDYYGAPDNCRYMRHLSKEKVYTVDRPAKLEERHYITIQRPPAGCDSAYQCYFVHAMLSNEERIAKRMEELHA